MSVSICMCTAAWACRGHRTTWSIIPQVLSSLFFETESFTGSADHQVQDSACPCLPSTGIKSTCHHTQHFYMDSGNWTQLLMLVWLAVYWRTSPKPSCCSNQFVYSCNLPCEVPLASLKPRRLDCFFPFCSKSADVKYMCWVPELLTDVFTHLWLLSW